MYLLISYSMMSIVLDVWQWCVLQEASLSQNSALSSPVYFFFQDEALYRHNGLVWVAGIRDRKRIFLQLMASSVPSALKIREEFIRYVDKQHGIQNDMIFLK